MEYGSADDLVDILNQYSINEQELSINHGRYCYGYVIPKHKRMFLNKNNTCKANIDTVSHELVHIYYDWEKKLDLPEKEIERISQIHLAMHKEYFDSICKRVMIMYDEHNRDTTTNL